MSSIYNDRIAGLDPYTAIKAPVVAATTANITLSGEQTIDGVAVVAGNRVLVKNQTTGSENGIYDASASTWTRAADFNDARDVVQGTLVAVNSGAVSSNVIYALITGSPVIGTSSLSFTSAFNASAAIVPYTETDDDIALLTIPATTKILARLPTTESAGQVAPQDELTFWRIESGTPSGDYFTTVGPVNWVKTGPRDDTWLSILSGALANFAFSDSTDLDDLHDMTVPFANRAAFIAATIPTLATRASWLDDEWGVLSVVRTAGGPITSAGGVEWAPTGKLTLQHFGAVADWNGTTGTDNATAFAAAVTYIESAPTRQIHVRGRFLTSAPWLFSSTSTFGVWIIGEPGEGSVSEIVGSHTSGPIIQMRKSYGRIENVTLRNTTARAAASYNIMNAGVIVGDFDWTSPTTSPGSSGILFDVEHCIIEYQPGPGVLSVGGGGMIARNEVNDCKGHGIQIDGGDEIGATMGGYPGGWTEIRLNRVDDCGGHGICVGSADIDTTNMPYRIKVENNDVNNNATDAAVRNTLHQFYLTGEQIESSLNVANSATTGGMFIAGRQHRHQDNRFANIINEAYEIDDLTSYSTSGMVIDGFRLSNLPSNLNPAIKLSAAATSNLVSSDGIVVRQGSSVKITKLVADAVRDKFASIHYQDDLDVYGALKFGGSSVATVVALSAVTPTVTFDTPDDFSPSYTTQSASYFESGGAAFIQGNLLFDTNAYSGTVAGPFLINLSALPFNMDSDAADRCGLNIGSMSNIVYDTGQLQATMYAAGAKQLRLSFNNSGAAREDADTVNIPASTSNIGISFSGWVKVA